MSLWLYDVMALQNDQWLWLTHDEPILDAVMEGVLEQARVLAPGAVEFAVIRRVRRVHRFQEQR